MKKYEETLPYKLATILDPRFKMNWSENQSELKEILINEIKNFSNIIEEPFIEDKANEPPLKRSKFFAFLDKNEIKEKVIKNPSRMLEEEVEIYLNKALEEEEVNPLDFWKNNNEKFPQLSKLCIKYLGICASSAPVERLFSVAGKFYTSHRTNLKPENFENLIFLKMNKI